MRLVQIKESLGIIFRKCPEVEDVIEEEMTKAESLFIRGLQLCSLAGQTFPIGPRKKRKTWKYMLLVSG
jgi:hypothetical protein